MFPPSRGPVRSSPSGQGISAQTSSDVWIPARRFSRSEVTHVTRPWKSIGSPPSVSEKRSWPNPSPAGDRCTAKKANRTGMGAAAPASKTPPPAAMAVTARDVETEGSSGLPMAVASFAVSHPIRRAPREPWRVPRTRTGSACRPTSADDPGLGEWGLPATDPPRRGPASPGPPRKCREPPLKRLEPEPPLCR